MKISVITLFPEMFGPVIGSSILKRAQGKGLVEINLIDHRQFGDGKHMIVDDKPYGGGAGMILKVDVLDRAIQSVKTGQKGELVVLLDAQGEVYSQKKAEELALVSHLILICGHYEGFDERVRTLVDCEISIGDYVLTGGELPAMVVLDSIVRLLPGVLKDTSATVNESHSEIDGRRILEGPQYTRPEDFKGNKVPNIFLSGDPKKINEFKRSEALIKTSAKRPDLLSKSTD